MSVPTILFQPPNHRGLGHISRLLAIALATRDACANVRTPFLIDGHAHGLVEAYGLPHVSLVPGHDLYDTPVWSAWPMSERQGLAMDVALALIRHAKPDLLVFDCFPNPAVVHAGMERRLPIVLCLRKSRQMAAYFDMLRPFWPVVELVLVAHAEGECEVPAALRSRTVFTGPIVRPAPPGPPVEPPVPLGDKLVVITGGGGGIPETVHFYNLAIDAFARAREREPALSAYLVAGPLFTGWSRLKMTKDLRVVPFDPHLSQTLARAGLIVCQGGYNTVSEILPLGVPVVCMPAGTLADDQFERAEIAARRTPNFHAYTGDDPAALASLMLNGLSAGRTAMPDGPSATAGARTAATRLLDMLSARRTA